MKVKYRRGYDPEEVIDVDSISTGFDRLDDGWAYLILTQYNGQQVYATYCDLDSDGVFVAGCPENF